MNNRRLTKKKQVQILVALTILAWATQTLLHQWGYGQEVAPTLDAMSDSTGADKFVPQAGDATPSGTLELRDDASIFGADVTLKQVCRWSDCDAPIFIPIADLKILQFSGSVSFRTITVDDIRETLHEAGVNIAMINFTGATICSITRNDGGGQPTQTVQQWLDAQQGGDAAKPEPVLAAATEQKSEPTFHSLRDLLVNDLSQRLNIPAEALQLDFSQQDQRVLSLSEPVFKFDVTPSRARALGNVSWQVKIYAGTTSKDLIISALARQWENEVIVAKPLPAHTVLRAEDFATHRVLVDSMPEHQPLAIDQCVGQEAAIDLEPGTIMSAQYVDPVPLVKPGQLVTITLRKGTIELRSVARAMEEGAMGQTIRVRKENTRDVMDVTVTGPQEARLGDNSDEQN
jgi:flagella basal body P-ring formation protein FlgA